MPIEILYVCDNSGRSCSDTDIVADETGATQRVVLDATIYFRNSGGDVSVRAMGQHVFASIEDALTWAQGINV